MKSRLLRLLAVRADPVLLRLLAALSILVALTAWHQWGMARLEPDPGARPLRPLAAWSEGDRESLHPASGPGRIEIADGRARLSNPGQQGIVSLRVPIPSPAALPGVRVVAVVSGEAIQTSGDWRNGGHVRMVGRAPDGRALYDKELHVLRLVGTRTPFRVARDVPLPSGSHGATLVVELVRASGALNVEQLVLQPLRERPLFTLTRAGLVASWVAVIGWLGIRLLGALRSPVLATTLGLTAIVAVVLLIMPRPAEQRFVGELARRFGLEGVDLGTLGDAGHVAVFAALALLVTVAVRGRSPWVGLGILALAAPLAEYAQLLTDGRSAEPDDALRNLLGVALGGGLGLLVRRVTGGRSATARTEVG